MATAAYVTMTHTDLCAVAASFWKVCKYDLHGRSGKVTILQLYLPSAIMSTLYGRLILNDIRFAILIWRQLNPMRHICDTNNLPAKSHS